MPVALQCRLTLTQQLHFVVLGEGGVILQQRVHLFMQRQHRLPWCQQPMVGLGQEKHVVDHLCHPLQLLKVAVQCFAVFLEATGAGEGDLGVGQQVGQWRAQFVGDVGRKCRQALEGIVQALQHGVHASGQLGQLFGHLRHR
ncbi:hypothetical protein D3C79_768870 [compost metagenome]